MGAGRRTGGGSSTSQRLPLEKFNRDRGYLSSHKRSLQRGGVGPEPKAWAVVLCWLGLITPDTTSLDTTPVLVGHDDTGRRVVAYQ